MHFCFDNSEIIEVLKKRGEYLMKGNYKKLKMIENQIYKALESKSEKYRTPVAAYIIFETQENKTRCLKEF